ncbi:MAG: hypothetical protein LBB89_05205 [Treponema sp.]|jgi:hypothetical protein|nr:hypothetical protein [Treponema sp.]
MTTVVNERPIPTGEGLTFEKVWVMFQETDRKFQETERLMKENAKQFEREMKKNAERFEREMKEKAEQWEKQHKETERIVGKLGNRFGELVEHLVAPNIREKFNEMGFCFTKTAMDIEINDPENPKAYAEVDVLLENGDIVVAVEVKSKPNDKDVNDHVRRMEILRSHADKKQDKRRYQGAIAGAVMSEAVRRYILKKGFYVIEQTGDTVQINIPQGFKAREW